MGNISWKKGVEFRQMARELGFEVMISVAGETGFLHHTKADGNISLSLTHRQAASAFRFNRLESNSAQQQMLDRNKFGRT